MNFEWELMQLEEKIEKADSVDDLDYLRRVNKKEYWWTSILIPGLFYAINGKVGKMLLTWILGVLTLTIYIWYIVYTSHRDQKYFNNQMESYILKRKKELKKEQ